MKRNLLIVMLLILTGVSMKAQSVATEQMDERFNDGTKLPYGWFTEGWTVKDGVIQSKGSSGFNFDMENMMGEGEGSGPDMNSLMDSFMGGNKKISYLLTPPLMVKSGETLVFSAKKAEDDDESSGMSISLGASDSTFVVERSVYSRDEWVRVADFTTELSAEFKTFTIVNTAAGQYRFRFKASGAVAIDSVAGFHIDSDAPDIYIIENDARAKELDYSLCLEDSTRTLGIINTATGVLKGNIASIFEGASFVLSTNNIEVNAADTLKVDVTFNVAGGKPGKNETEIEFTPADNRITNRYISAMAVVTQPGVWMENFNSNTQPKGFFTEGWIFHDNAATPNSGGMGAMLGGSTSFIMTPPLKVANNKDVLLFSARSGSGDDGMAGMGAMFGGGGSSVVIEKSVYGSNKWEKVREYTEPLDSTYRVLWVSDIEPGEYRFRIIASDSIVVDSIAGFEIDNNAPDIYVLYNNTAARAINFGMPQAISIDSLGIVNTGTGSLQVGMTSSDEEVFRINARNLAIEANDTAYAKIAYLFNPKSLGTHQGLITFTPKAEVLVPRAYPIIAYSTYADAWKEDFEPEFIPADETDPIDLPENWNTTGWEVKLPGSGGGFMDMFSGMMGGDNEAPKTWMATTSSEAYELITPRLQANKGDVLRFEAELGGGGMMSMMGMFMGGGASGQLTVEYTLDDGKTWNYYDTFVLNGYQYFIAPYNGVYQLRFTSPNASLDNFYGFRKPLDQIAIHDNSDELNQEVLEKYDGKNVNVSYDRQLSAIQQKDGTWMPRAYIVSLPYDYNFTDYYEVDQAKIFRLYFKEEYYKQFVFLPQNSSQPTKMLAGRSYLVLVLKGQINLSATNVILKSSIVDDDNNTVYGFEDWYFQDKYTPVGKWLANFRGITAKEADNMNIYGLREDGTWARFKSEEGQEDAVLTAFRGYMEASQGSIPSYAGPRAPKPGTYKTMFQVSDQQGTSTDDNVDYDALNYEGNIPLNDLPTTVQPTFRAIDTDGTSLYFDMQGRPLNNIPDKGMYIEDGVKKVK